MSRILTKEIVKYEGEEVELKGWVDSRRDHGGLIFIDIRDRSGMAQVVFNPKNTADPHKMAERLRTAFVIWIKGEVKRRPRGMENPNLPTGDYEVSVKDGDIINEAQTPPILTDGGGYDISEETRMKYRYVDLRRSRLQKNMRNRAKITKFIRDFLTERDFTEVETPILSKSTPEGARDYVVPSRLQTGKFYALPQSPQQYKQLLMVAGLERYFQIARCFRDEDTRGDRQPEFTQLDLEMSFASQKEILDLTEELFTALVEKIYPEKKITAKPFPRITYAEAMEKYGSDKPDLRKDKNNPNELAFAFIYGFPMFEKKNDGSLGAVHHPFTLPTFDENEDPENYQHERESWKKLIEVLMKKNEKELLELKAYQYDFVCNGYEVGGGSIRAYEWGVLRFVFEALGYSRERIEEDFGHMLEAFSFGVPPHGGIAPGIDRLVMILQNEPNIREVIAFPKTGDGRDLMMGAPAEITKEQLKELHLKVEKKD